MDAATLTAREATMKAILQERYGGLDVLELREIDRPVPGDDEVLCGCTRPASTGASGM